LSEKLDKIRWTREQNLFERKIGVYILRKLFELAKGPRVLDVACGDGYLTNFMADHYGEVVGVDGSAEKIQLARMRESKASFHVSLFEEYESDEPFNSVLMVNFLEHADKPVDCIRKAKSLLARNGEVVAFVPNALSLNRRLGVAMGIIRSPYELSEADHRVGHRRFYDRKKLAGDFLRANMTPTVGGMFLKPLPKVQMASWSLELFEALYAVGEELPDYCGLVYVRATK